MNEGRVALNENKEFNAPWGNVGFLQNMPWSNPINEPEEVKEEEIITTNLPWSYNEIENKAEKIVEDNIPKLNQIIDEEFEAEKAETVVENTVTETEISVSTEIPIAEPVAEPFAKSETENVKEEVAEEEKRVWSEMANALNSYPISDVTFSNKLKEATLEELKEALELISMRGRSATKIARINARIKKLEKGENETTEKVVEFKPASEDEPTEVSVTEDKEKTDVAAETANDADTNETDEVENKNDTTNDEAEVEDNLPKEPIFKEDEFVKINLQDIPDKEKSILYMLNHYHIAPDLLNSLLEGNFEGAWENIKALNTENQSVKDKLTKELGDANDDRLKIVRFLVKKATDEPEFANQIMLEHKNFERCFNFITNKVRETFAKQPNGCVQVDDDKVYSWAVEYYWLDDFEQVMEERRKKEEAERKRKEAAERKKKKGTKKTAKTTKKADEKKAEEKVVEAKSETTTSETTTEAKTETEVKDEVKVVEKEDVKVVESSVPVNTADITPSVEDSYGHLSFSF